VRVIRWLDDRPAPCYLLAAMLATSLLVAFVLQLEARTLTLVASGVFGGLLGWWTFAVRCKWREADPLERIVGVVG